MRTWSKGMTIRWPRRQMYLTIRLSWTSRLKTQLCRNLHRSTLRKTSPEQVITLTNWSITTQVTYPRKTPISCPLRTCLRVTCPNQTNNKYDKEVRQPTPTLRKAVSYLCKRHNRRAELVLRWIIKKVGKVARNRPTLMSSPRAVTLWRSYSKTIPPRTTTHPTWDRVRKWRHQTRQVPPSQPPVTSKIWWKRWLGRPPPTTTQSARNQEQTNGKGNDQTLSKSQDLSGWRATRPWGQTMRRRAECLLRAICRLWQRMGIRLQSKTAAILGPIKSNFLQCLPMNCPSWWCPTRRKLPISRRQPTKNQLYHPRISVQQSARQTKKTSLAKKKRSREGAEEKENEPCYAELTMSSWMIWRKELSPSWTSRLSSRM